MCGFQTHQMSYINVEKNIRPAIIQVIRMLQTALRAAATLDVKLLLGSGQKFCTRSRNQPLLYGIASYMTITYVHATYIRIVLNYIRLYTHMHQNYIRTQIYKASPR